MTTTGSLVPGYIAGTWHIDPAHSYIGFSVRHMMVSKVRGQFRSFHGRIVTAAEPLDSTVTVSVEAASIDTGNEMRDDHVRSADFFAAEQYPEFTFNSTAVRVEADRFFLDGSLTIRGRTRPVTLDMQVPLFQLADDGGKAGFSATTEINRTDFAVNYNGPLPGGGVTLGEKVQIFLDIEADLAR